MELSPDPVDTFTAASSSSQDILSIHDQLFANFQRDLLPSLCDVLFTQASYDLGHLNFLEFVGHCKGN